MEDAEAPDMPGAAEPAVCRHCGGKIAREDHYCRHCGRGQGSHVAWYYTHWGVVLSTLGLGPFSLFLVWRSPLFTKNVKLVYTLALLSLTWYAGSVLYRFWLTMQAMLGQVYAY